MTKKTQPAKPAKRCSWAEVSDLDRHYHDEEWGVPIHDEHQLFEMICLEGAQAGLSWTTILKKREGYRKAFANFDPDRVARFRQARIEKLVLNPEIVRHRGKIESVVQNAKAVRKMRAEIAFSDYVWSWVNGEPIQNDFRKIEDVPGQTEISKAFSKDLKKRGFAFVGPTTVYAFMQAAGLVNDHLRTCFRHAKN